MTPGDRPSRSAFVLLAMVTGAIVANINLSIANVALPTIGHDLSASQDQLTGIANAFALGLASTVLYLGTIGDRYGRKLLFTLGGILTIPTSLLAAWAPNAEMLTIARFLGGIAAALLFPTTLSLINALYRNKAKVGAIALWSGIGGGGAALGPLLGGWLLESYWWGSVFLITLPLDIIALIIGLIVLPWHASEEKFRVDHLGGILSVLGVGGLVLSIEIADRGFTAGWFALFFSALIALALFFWRQTKAPRPLVSLPLAKARTFWVAFVAGAITFGSLIGAMFIGQQFTQNVLGYTTFQAAEVVLPAAIFTALGGALGGRLISGKGSQFTFMLGLGSVALAFTLMLITWTDQAHLGWILAAYTFMGLGVGLASTSASRALMSSVPPSRGGMGSSFLDLTRDFGGAILQALMGGLLAAAYASHMLASISSAPSDEASTITDQISDQLTGSFTSAADVAQQYPQYSTDILAAASQAFTDGKSAAIAVALAMTLIGLVLVLLRFPGKAKEETFYEQIAAMEPATGQPHASTSA
ncbi:MAG: MFS transporter [Actinomycetes bacterium]